MSEDPKTHTDEFHIIAAVDEAGAIGKDGTTPWHLPEDLAIFRKFTLSVEDPMKHNVLVCGSKTKKTLPANFLDREVYVITRRPNPEIVTEFGNIKDALMKAWRDPDVEKVFIIGGGQIYAEAIKMTGCRSIYLTRIHATFPDCDTFFPKIDASGYKMDRMGISGDRTSKCGLVYHTEKYYGYVASVWL